MNNTALKLVGQRSRPSTRHRRSRMRRPIMRRHTTIDGITYKVADSFRERQAAFELVYQAYAEKGLAGPNGWKLRLSARHLLPDSAVFIACDGDKVVSTVSLLSGRGMGLLLEQEFGAEVESLRSDGLNLAEISSLASRKDYLGHRQMFGIFKNLVGLMVSYARHNAMERLLIAVHPKHARFYERSFGFRQIGKQRSYARVQGQPAVACVHDFDRFDAQASPLKEHLISLRFEPWELTPRPIPTSERDYFAGAWQSLCTLADAA